MDKLNECGACVTSSEPYVRSIAYHRTVGALEQSEFGHNTRVHL